MVSLGRKAGQAFAYSPNDGALDPILATQTLVKAAVSMGANLKTNCSAIGVNESMHSGVTLAQS